MATIGQPNRQAYPAIPPPQAARAPIDTFAIIFTEPTPDNGIRIAQRLILSTYRGATRANVGLMTK